MNFQTTLIVMHLPSYSSYTVDTVASYAIDDLKNMGRNARIIEGRAAEILPTERIIAVRVGTSPFYDGIYDYHFMAQ